MKDFIVVIFIGQLLLCAIGGPINSDPAPGRSPGPPISSSSASDLQLLSSSSISNSKHPQIPSNEVFNENQKSVDENLQSQSNQLHDQLNLNIPNGKNKHQLLLPSSSSSSSSSSSLSSSQYSQLLPPTNELHDKKTLKNSNEVIASSSSSTTTLSTNQISSTLPTNLCYENFIRDNDKIIKVNHSNNDDVNNDDDDDDDYDGELKSSLHLDVINNVFSTENGLLPNIIYIVGLSHPEGKPIREFYVETLLGDDDLNQPIGIFFNEKSKEFQFSHKSSPPSSSSSSSLPSQNHKRLKNIWPNLQSPPDVSEFLKPIRPNSDEQLISPQFWLNTVNNPDHEDLIRAQNPKTPTTNRWDHHKEMNPMEEDYVMSDESIGPDDENRGDEIENNETFNDDELPQEDDGELGDGTGMVDDVECNKNVWNEKWTMVDNERIFINWTIDTIIYPTNKATRAIRSRSDKSDSRTYETIAFRILYRTMKSQNIYEIIYRFLLLKDCILHLKNNIGFLDNTHLPVHNENCTVYFPSRDLKSSEPSGLLIQLNRLNVPCTENGGFIKFTNKSQFLCGKLEELPVNDRTYYFTSSTSLLSSTSSDNIKFKTNHNNNNNSNNNNTPNINNNNNKISVNLYKSPLFSLNYKLVDYCYNVTFKSKNNTIFLRPLNELECFFKIHLPYGNKIVLNIVTNSRRFQQPNRQQPPQRNHKLNNNNNKMLTNKSLLDRINIKNSGNNKSLISEFNNKNHNNNNNNKWEFININLQLQKHSNNLLSTTTTTTTTTTSSSNVNSNSFNSKGNSGSSGGSDDGVIIINDHNDKESDNILALNKNYNSHNRKLGKINKCNGILIELFDNNINEWFYCIDSSMTTKNFTFLSSGNTLGVRVLKSLKNKSHQLLSSSVSTTSSKATNSKRTLKNDTEDNDDDDEEINDNDGDDDDDEELKDVPSVLMQYFAQSIETIVSQCAFGWVAFGQFCITAVEMELPWQQAESECNKRSGHLASIRSDTEQNIIDQLLMNSPGYRDHNAYWIGASDKNVEGDFHWSDGLPFRYSNWFTGWAQHAHFNRQPNDDGLSGQDCVEIRRHFSIPPGGPPTPTPLSPSYRWNDRDCNVKNFFLCERPMSNELVEKWSSDCNQTIVLTRDHPRQTIESPGFPGYPDDSNCLTVVTAPEGYRLILDFDELVLETEPSCSYDYLEIFEQSKITTTPSDKIHRNYQRGGTGGGGGGGSYNHAKRTFNTSTSNVVTQKMLFDNLLNHKKFHPTIVLSSSNRLTNIDLKKLSKISGPRKICGDWSSKVKLLRYVTENPVLVLHFVSDYSHHFGGYKAKVAMENVASECADERLKPYNGSCYLFVAYPQVNWDTARQVCESIDSHLTSISSADEQRFVTTNIRNHVDYTPRSLYWLGAESLAGTRIFEWTDGTKMNYEGWLPGQEDFLDGDEQINSTCLALQWKTSPTPMLPSGLYWATQKCTNVGGYVCKSQKHSSRDILIKNQTITGTEGRLVSPGYPKFYPSNLDYWIRIIGPERTRVILQFQKLDMEHQDECFYDYVSVRSYEPDSIDTQVDPGTNPIPMAMFQNDNLYIDYQSDETLNIDNDYLDKSIENRIKRLERNLRRNNYKRSISSENVGNRKKRFLTVDRVLKADVNNWRRFTKENSPTFRPYVRWCGSHETNMSKYDYISLNNQAILHFHSDYSTYGSGFSATWTAVDISGCPLQTLTAREGFLNSPNYPHFLLHSLDCTYLIQAPQGKKVWLEITDYDLTEDAEIVLDLGDGGFKPFNVVHMLNDGVFVSQKEKLRIRLQTGKSPKGKGFRMIYKTKNPVLEERTIKLTNNSHGTVLHLNYPKSISTDIEFTQHLIAPMGDNILLEMYGVELNDNSCPDGNGIEIYDNYADNNGSIWYFCDTDGHHNFQISPTYIISYLNSLHIKQKTTSESVIKLNASIKIQTDANFKEKLIKDDDWVESCQPNPCLFGGRCLSNGDKSACQCRGHYVGRFCGLNMCETDPNPCLFGKCELTATSFKCHCQPGYVGKTCDQRQKPCADSPCEGRGECMERNGGFHCRCYAWWEGQRCERRMINIPYKPLSERMLQEPFWLGLITVFIVLAIIGLVWCAKRHFPEKIEKLLSEEADRTRPLHSHHPSLREQLHFTTSIQQSSSTTPAAARTIFGRLGIRKPSILSLSSPQPPPGGSTARTFSLDDLLRPPPRRTPSPRKKRNNSTPTKKNAAEKKQILQQLISPAANTTRQKVTLGELIQLSENRLKVTTATMETEADEKETTFSEASGSTSIPRPLSDPKFEKKVTFARLLNKVSAEISSGSEIDAGNYKFQKGHHRNSSALSLPVEIPTRANSMPPSPSTNDMRSPHSTSSTQGSDSLSSSDLHLPDLHLKTGRRIRPKVSSADSILAMFKNFASSQQSFHSPQSKIISPSTTPTSPQDDLCDDDSSTSSIHTPVSFSSGPPDSPVFYRQSTIEVPVLDPLSAHKSNSNANLLHPPTILLEIPRDNNSMKCLSPIREMPTPIPSPALTPIMCRGNRMHQQNYENRNTGFPNSNSNTPNGDDDEDMDFVDVRPTTNPTLSKVPLIVDLQSKCNYNDSEIETNLTDTQSTTTTDESHISFPQRKTRLQRRAPAISISIDVDPPTPTEDSSSDQRELIIPTLTIEQPSPTRDRSHIILFPGSPPPQRASIGETSFMFPNKAQQKRLLKQFEKPTSLDLPFAPPMITITSNMSEIESDAESCSPAQGKSNANKLGMPPNTIGMCYLSPFSICTRGDRTTSESNLSSSGYSSMASPGPSRCGSNNPLCSSETEDPGTGHGLNFHSTLPNRRQNPMLRTCQEGSSEGSNGGSGSNGDGNSGQQDHTKNVRRKSDSETLSDDQLLESNDEGIGTDHIDEKIEDGEIKSAKELEIYIGKELLDNGKSLLNSDEPMAMAQLKLPSIVIQSDAGEKGVSPVSSRSESPLSERTGMGRFSPLFYGRKDNQLPFTDSDGLYDFPSSDGKGNMCTHQRKSSKRRERKSSRGGLQHSPSKTSAHLEIPAKENPSNHHQSSKHYHHHHASLSTTRKSPKRRPIQRHPVASSSSSSENLTSAREDTVSPRTKVHPSSTNKSDISHFMDAKPPKISRDGSVDDTEEDVSTPTLPKVTGTDGIRPQRKINRLRAIGHQIRFLRRLEQSIKQKEKERLVSPPDSSLEEINDESDSPRITSPLLQPALKTTRPMLSKTSRQKRVVCHPNEKLWREKEKIMIHGDINSD